jgi:hypothetical protein
MAYVLTQPRALAAAAANVAGVGSALNEANVTAAGPTTGVLAAAADEVSAATATLFSSYARGYQALTKQAAAFHDEFARVLAAAGNFGRDLRDRSLALGPAPNRHDDVGAGGRQSFRRTKSQAAVGSGHDGESAGHIRHFQRQVGLHHVTGSS